MTNQRKQRKSTSHRQSVLIHPSVRSAPHFLNPSDPFIGTRVDRERSRSAAQSPLEDMDPERIKMADHHGASTTNDAELDRDEEEEEEEQQQQQQHHHESAKDALEAAVRHPRPRATKRRRQSKSKALSLEDDRKRKYVDLMVPVSLNNSISSKNQSQPPTDTTTTLMLLLSSLIDRFESSGYSAIALTHTIYGTPTTNEDTVNPLTSIVTQLQAEQRRKGRRNKPNYNRRRPLQLLTRLHAVVENLSDVGWYALPPPTTETTSIEDDVTRKRRHYLQQYNLVSLAPRNDATFQAACQSVQSGGGVDLLTLDYSSTTKSSRGRLPYKIRAKDLQSAIQRNVVLEIPYAPAMLHPNHRRAFVQTFRDVQTASLALKPKIVVSSGSRLQTATGWDNASGFHSDQSDVGALALRLPGDVRNVLEFTMHMDPVTALASFTTHPHWVLQQACARKIAYNSTPTASTIKIVAVTEEEDEVEDDREALLEKPKQRERSSGVVGVIGPSSTSQYIRPKTSPTNSNDPDEGLHDDGYIAL